MHNANEHQVGGNHYAAGVQHWDYVLGALRGRYLEGNITKYVARHRKKNGKQDLEKACHYTQKLMEVFANGGIQAFYTVGMVPDMPSIVMEFASKNALNYHETRVMILACSWRSMEDLQEMQREIDLLVKANGEALAAEPTREYVAQGEDTQATIEQTSKCIDVHYESVGNIVALSITGCTTVEETARLSEYFWEQMELNLNGG